MALKKPPADADVPTDGEVTATDVADADVPTDGEVTVTMLFPVSGTRDGKEWPAVGETITVPADEAAQLIATGIAK
jgi:hypothetical protein